MSKKQVQSFFQWDSVKISRLLFVLFMAIGIAVRVWRFGLVPKGINQDEALAAYESYSLLRTGLDTAGYPFPIYLTAWGSGMNVLESILMMPFIALFGLKTWVIRLPQLIVAVLSLIAVYDILKRIAGVWAALCGLFLMAAVPWHVFLARWGLESNLAPGFLLFGLCFFLWGLENARVFPLSALMYGLSLYCYATIWPFVPFILLLQTIYAWRCGKLAFKNGTWLWLVLAAVLLFLLALPLLLFLLVNLGFIEEIQLSLPFFRLSIPRLIYLRSGEFSFSRIPENARTLLRIFLTQNDGLLWNGTERFGLFYYCTLPFFFIGLYYCIRGSISAVRGIRQQSFFGGGILLVQLLAGVIQGLLISSNVNRVNSLWPAVILVSAVGIWRLCSYLGQKSLILPLIFYAVLFGQFSCYYFTDYAQESAWYFCYGLEEALEEALAHDGTICVSSDANFARVLFYTKQDPDEYRATVQYSNYPSAYLNVDSFGRFRFVSGTYGLDSSCVYVLNTSNNLTPLVDAGFTVQTFGYYAAAYYE